MKTKTKTRTRKATTKSATRSSTGRATARAARRRVRRISAAGGDAIGVLKSDHVRIKTALAALADARTATRRASLIAEVERLLKQHTNAEEELFYPAFREAAKTKEDRKLFHEAARSTTSSIWCCPRFAPRATSPRCSQRAPRC
jgi:hypothetical protein